jgi:hypothetical protein
MMEMHYYCAACARELDADEIMGSPTISQGPDKPYLYICRTYAVCGNPEARKPLAALWRAQRRALR